MICAIDSYELLDILMYPLLFNLEIFLAGPIPIIMEVSHDIIEFDCRII